MGREIVSHGNPTRAAVINDRLFPAAYFLVLTIFSRELGKGTLMGFDIDWISYPFYVVAFAALLILGKLDFDQYVLTLFTIVIVGSILAKLYLGLTFGPLGKQILPIVLIYTVCSYILRRVHITSIFRLYIKFALVAAIIGIIQFLLKFLDVHVLTTYSHYKVDSIAEEPSHFAAIILPAVIYTFLERDRFRWQSIVILIAMLLSFNVTAYIVFFFSLLIIYKKFYHALLVVPTLIYLGYFFYSIDPNVQYRVDGMIEYYWERSLESLHGTPLSFLSNLEVAFYSVGRNPLFGAGLGGHEEMYYRYFGLNKFSNLEYLFGLNAKSAHCLTIRVLSELGLVGFISFMIVLVKPLLISRKSIYFPIGLACLSHFMCKALKLGNYFDLGTPFFFLLIIYVYRTYKRESKGKAVNSNRLVPSSI